MSKIICIDAGHGGKDAGAVHGNRYEKNDNLCFALALGQSLTKQGFVVYQTRTQDTDMSLKARTDLANRVKADAFISCHRNSFVLPTAHGVENWVYTYADNATLSCARAIQDELVKVGVQANRGVKKGNYHVCRVTNMPACLLELGFIKNAKDNELYDGKFNEYVEAVTKGICNYFGVNIQTAPQSNPITTQTKPTANLQPSAGQIIELKGIPLYVTAYNTASAKRISGKYYLYDGVLVNGRYRITNSLGRVNKQPTGANVTGWINAGNVK